MDQIDELNRLSADLLDGKVGPNFGASPSGAWGTSPAK